jgi:hypothetical protein
VTASGDPVPAISEAEATGAIADLYADIRATLGVPIVNLIWRNLAAIPGGLAWAWGSVRPLYAAGQVLNEARALRAGQALPAMPRLPDGALRACGVDAAAEKTIRAILDSYDRSNALNLVTLLALLARLRDEPAAAGFARPPSSEDRRATTRAPGAGAPAPHVAPELPVAAPLPPLLALDQVAADTAALVRAVNRLGAGGADHILVSMPRQLAHWPGFLALYWSLLAPLDAGGALGDCVAAVRSDGRARGGRLAANLGHPAEPGRESLAAVEASLDDFCQNAISRMIPVVSLLQRAMPDEG